MAFMALWMGEVSGQCTVNLTAGMLKQTKCEGIFIETITFALGTSIDDETTTGLPSWLTKSFTGGAEYSLTQNTNAPVGSYNIKIVFKGIGCADVTKEVEIEVNPIPTATATAAPNPICTGSTLNLGSTGAGLGTYAWSGPAGFTSNLQNPTRANITIAHAGVYSVIVTSTTGCKDTATVNVQVNQKPTATAAADPNPICTGSTLNLSSTGAGLGTYAWSGPAGFTSNLQNPTRANITVAHAGVYSVIVTSTTGCKDTATVNVIVNPIGSPGCACSIQNNDITQNIPPIFCGAQSVIIIGQSASPIGTYKWLHKIGTGNYMVAQAPNNLKDYTTAILAIGEHKFKRVYSITGVGACADTSNEVSITINELPNASIAITEVSGTPNDGTICKGSSAKLTASGGITYQWDNNLGTGPTKDISPSVTTTYKVTVTNSGGCTSTATVTINVTNLPNASIDVTEGSGTPNDGTICKGSSAKLTASGGTSYQWDNNLGTGPTKDVTPSVTTTYKVTVTGTGGCTSTATVIINVNDLPNASIAITEGSGAPNDGTICKGSSVKLTASGGNSYQWDNNLGTGPSKDVSPALTTTYMVAVTNTGGCTSIASTTINVSAPPNAPQAEINQTLCFDNAFHTPVANPPAGATLLWYENQSGGTPIQVPQFKDPNTYTVYVSSFEGSCESARMPIVFVINPSPIVKALVNDNSVCINETIDLEATFTQNGSSTAPTSWNWSGPNSFSNTSRNPQPFQAININQSGTYNVTVTDNNNCTNTASLNVSVNLLPDLSDDKFSTINVDCFGNSTGQITLSLANSDFSFVWANQVITIPDTDNSIGSLSAGIYNVKVTNKNTMCFSEKLNILITEPTELTSGLQSIESFCINSSVDINAKPNGGTAPYKYKWYRNDVLLPGQNEISLTVNTADTYKVEITDNNKCITSTACDVTQSNTVDVDFSASVIPIKDNTAFFCRGGNVTISGDKGNTYNYSWSTGETSPQITRSEPGALSLTLTDTKSGCTGTDTINVMQKDDPVFKYYNDTKSDMGTADDFCDGEFKTVRLDPPLSPPSRTYMWNDGMIVDARSLSQGEYSVQAKDGDGCVFSKPLTINAYPSPELRLVYQGNPNIDINNIADCIESVPSRLRSTTAIVVNNILWHIEFSGSLTLEDFIMDTAVNNVDFIIPIIDTSFNKMKILITVEDNTNNHCISSEEFNFDIIKNTNLQIQDATQLCDVILIKKSFTVKNVENIEGNSIEISDHIYYVNGISNFYVIDNESQCPYVQKISNKLNNIPVIDITQIENIAVDSCGPYLLSFEKNGYCYTWIDIITEEIKIQNGKNSFFKIDGIGDQNRYVAIGRPCVNPCEGSDSTIISTRSNDSSGDIGCYNGSERKQISVWPNPNNGHMNVRFTGFETGTETLIIHDIVGRNVYRLPITLIGNAEGVNIDLPDLPPGVYVASLYNGSTAVHTKFIIAK